MHRAQPRLSFVEVMVVGAVLAIAVGLAGREFRAQHVRNNEKAVMATLRLVADAQAQCQASAAIDVDGDGNGEFGFFGELSGRVLVRAGVQTLSPPLLSAAFKTLNSQSCASRAGYLFRMWLPTATGMGVTEMPSGGDPFNACGVAPNQAEALWCCYAWPMAYGTTGKRTFFVNQDDEILFTFGAVAPYDGTNAMPWSFAAFASVTTGSMDCAVAADTTGIDGNMWRLVH